MGKKKNGERVRETVRAPGVTMRSFLLPKTRRIDGRETTTLLVAANRVSGPDTIHRMCDATRGDATCAWKWQAPVSYTHLRAHETEADL
eukprot:1441718-Rhodomonas_salina.5